MKNIPLNIEFKVKKYEAIGTTIMASVNARSLKIIWLDWERLALV